MLSNLDILKLVRVPVTDGTLYLYLEYVAQADRFSFATPPQRLGGSRKVFLHSPDQEFSFVAKEERPSKDHYRVKYAYRWNSAVREISIARLFSSLACFEDKDAFISHEAPYGFYESSDGAKTSLYKYYPFSKELTGPTCLTEVIEMLNRREEEEKKGVDKRFRVLDVEEKYMRRRHKAKELYYPIAFAAVLLGYNGLDHNEGTYKSPAHRREDGKPGRIILDFEFCQPNEHSSIEQSIDYWLYTCTPRSTSFGSALKQFQELPPQERRAWALEQLEEAREETFYSSIARRFRTYLEGSGYFEGQMERLGPASPFVSKVCKLRLDDIVIP